MSPCADFLDLLLDVSSVLNRSKRDSLFSTSNTDVLQIDLYQASSHSVVELQRNTLQPITYGTDQGEILAF